MAGKTGSYPISASNHREIERLARQSEVWAPDAQVMFDRLGVGAGWRCLDLGCGPEGITRMLSERVGGTGRVTGLEYNDEFVQFARANAPDNVDIVQGDAWKTGLPDASFDLVHTRFLASTSGRVEELIAESARLLRPGGWLAMQEALPGGVGCFPPHPAWDRVIGVLKSLFPAIDSDYPAACRHVSLMEERGLTEVSFRPCVYGCRGGELWHDWLPETAVSARQSILDAGLIDAVEFDDRIADLRAHLSKPDTLFVSFTLVQVWGRRPKEAS